MEYTITEAVEFLQYAENWNADNDAICIDLMDKHSGYIFQWNDEQFKFIGIFIEN